MTNNQFSLLYPKGPTDFFRFFLETPTDYAYSIIVHISCNRSTSIPSRYHGIVLDNTLDRIFVHDVLVLFVIPQTGEMMIVRGVVLRPSFLLLCLLPPSFFSSCSHRGLSAGCDGRQLQWTWQLQWTAMTQEGRGQALYSLFCLHRFSVAVMDSGSSGRCQW